MRSPDFDFYIFGIRRSWGFQNGMSLTSPNFFLELILVHMWAARSNGREIPKQFCKTKFEKPKSINGQFESLLFTFEPLECDNKEDICYWNLEFIDRNQSIIVLVF